MLEPTNRFMLVDALRPPTGHTLDIAVGTTFTLDLDALLLATVSFAVFDRTDSEDGRPDPIALLESVRRHADRITVFAQAGALSGPRSHPPILAYLEEAIVPVRPPRPGHLFHPKMWALRFVDEAGTARFRLLIMSRNLTFDASWDTMVVLDSRPGVEARQYAGVVGDFVEGLPALALHQLDERRSDDIARLATELRDVRWERPPGVNWLRFHPLGPPFPSPNLSGNRLLVMSPFLSDDAVRSLGEAPGPNLLISRASALDRLGGEALSGFAKTYVVDTGDDLLTDPLDLNHDAETSKEDSDAGEATSDFDIEPPRPGVELSGLHAKVYVTENDDYTRLWLGSANATGAAFGGNAEFMIELGLDRTDWTIDRFLNDGGASNLSSLLTQYDVSDTEPVEPTALEEAARRLDSILRQLAMANYRVDVSASGDDYRLEIGWDALTEAVRGSLTNNDIEVTIGPATQAGVRAAYGERTAIIPSATLQAVTSFLVIEARTRVDGQDLSGRTLVNARLVGAPADRKEQLLASVLDDPDKVLRYLLFLLAELTGDDSLLKALGGGGASFDWAGNADAPPLLETLLRALAHAPESLERVAEFIDDLRIGTSDGLLPPGFADVWDPINAARETME